MSQATRPWQSDLDQCVAGLKELAPDVDRNAGYPYDSMRLVHESGLLNAVAPGELGGFDLGPAGDMVGFFEVLDALASGCSSTGQLVAVHYAAMATLKAVGSPEQLERFSKTTRDDGATFCYLGSEPTQRFTATGLRPVHNTIAKKVDGGWVVNGDKFFATGSVGCTYVMVLCWAEGYSDMSGIFVPVLRADDPGVDIRDTWDNMGQRATTSGTCSLEDVFVPDDMAIGAPGDFLKPRIVSPLFQLMFAALFNGQAQAALDFTISYMTEHATAPIGAERAIDEPHVAPLIGDMTVKLEAGRALVRRAAETLVALERREATAGETNLAVNQAQVFAAQSSVELGNTLFRLCGARATTRKFNADMYWRNARTLTLHDNLDRQLTNIGRSVLGM